MQFGFDLQEEEPLITPAENRERGELIDKRVCGAITGAEAAKLDDLNSRMDQHLHAVAPRDTAVLEKLEKLVGLATPEANAEFTKAAADALKTMPADICVNDVLTALGFDPVSLTAYHVARVIDALSPAGSRTEWVSYKPDEKKPGIRFRRK